MRAELAPLTAPSLQSTQTSLDSQAAITIDEIPGDFVLRAPQSSHSSKDSHDKAFFRCCGAFEKRTFDETFKVAQLLQTSAESHCFASRSWGTSDSCSVCGSSFFSDDWRQPIFTIICLDSSGSKLCGNQLKNKVRLLRWSRTLWNLKKILSKLLRLVIDKKKSFAGKI